MRPFDPENTLALNRLGLRFTDAATERAYRCWRLEITAQLIKWVHLAAWIMIIVLLALFYFMHRGFFSIFAPYWLTLFIPPYTLAVAISFLKSWQRWSLPTLVALQTVGGCGGIFMLSQIGGSPGTIVAWAIFVPMFVPFMRIPPAIAVMAITPALGWATFKMISLSFADAINLTDSIILSSTPGMAFVSIIVLCLMIDYVSRQSFIKDQVIQGQRQGLKHSQSVIRRYVPPSVAERIIAGDEATIEQPQRLRITVLFADIAGFTDIADRVEPEIMTEVLNDYMSAMADLIERHGGTLNEFAGDGLMALFGAPDTMAPEDQARNAIQAAQAMQTRMPELNERWRKLGLGAELSTRIGINTGMVSVGSYGSQGRMTYTAIGLQTNIASRIESAAEPGQILISDATYQLMSNEIECESKGEVECKGVHFPVRVYSPITPDSELQP